MKKISNRHLFDILIWLDIKKTTTFCIKTLRHFLLVLEVLVCLVGLLIWAIASAKLNKKASSFHKKCASPWDYIRNHVISKIQASSSPSPRCPEGHNSIKYIKTSGASFAKLTFVSDATFGNFLLWNIYTILWSNVIVLTFECQAWIIMLDI
jgi:hypothetical protein